MSLQQKYTLGKNKRLKSRKAIDELFTAGKSFSIFPFKVVFNIKSAATDPASLQAAFSVSKKYFKKAVHRNRIKRLMREAYRLQKNDLENSVVQKECRHLQLFFVYIGKDLPEYSLVESKMSLILKKLQKITDEETVVPS